MRPPRAEWAQLCEALEAVRDSLRALTHCVCTPEIAERVDEADAAISAFVESVNDSEYCEHP